MCQIFGTLIADEQQVYDLNYLDDQLVLGIKGTLSVVELKVIRQRLLAGHQGDHLRASPIDNRSAWVHCQHHARDIAELDLAPQFRVPFPTAPIRVPATGDVLFLR